MKNLQFICRFLAACAAMPLGAGCAHDQTPRESAEYVKNLEIAGIARTGRELKIYKYELTSGKLNSEKTECLSAYVTTEVEERLKNTLIDNKMIKVKADAADYVASSMEDPLSATVSSVQNQCGNKYILFIYYIKVQ